MILENFEQKLSNQAQMPVIKDKKLSNLILFTSIFLLW